MTNYLIDTNRAAKIMGNSGQLREVLVQRGQPKDQFFISITVLSELYFAVYASQRRGENLRNLDLLLVRIPVLDFDMAAAEVCGIIKAELKAKGRPIPGTDAQIAAVHKTGRYNPDWLRLGDSPRNPVSGAAPLHQQIRLTHLPRQFGDPLRQLIGRWLLALFDPLHQHTDHRGRPQGKPIVEIVLRYIAYSHRFAAQPLKPHLKRPLQDINALGLDEQLDERRIQVEKAQDGLEQGVAGGTRLRFGETCYVGEKLIQNLIAPPAQHVFLHVKGAIESSPCNLRLLHDLGDLDGGKAFLLYQADQGRIDSLSRTYGPLVVFDVIQIRAPVSYLENPLDLCPHLVYTKPR